MAASIRRHFLIVTVPGCGHFIPAISLAKKINENHDVTLVVCKAYLEHARKKEELTADDEKVIKIVGLEDGVPSDPSEDKVSYTSFQMAEKYGNPALRKLMRQIPHSNRREPVLDSQEPSVSYNIDKPVDVIMGDIFLTEALVVCAERHMPYYIFNCAALTPFKPFFEIDEDTPLADPSVNPMESFAGSRPKSEGPPIPVTAMTKKIALSLNRNIKPAKGIVSNTFLEFDKETIQELKTDERMKHMEFYCIGPLIPEDRIDKANDWSALQKQILDWLEGKPKNSVVYLSFGSVAIPGEERVVEAAKALLALGKPFIFSLKEALHSFLPAELRQGIASQFEDPKKLGLVLSWAPQKVILTHPAVQVFISHCGWNSTIESLFAGKPVVGWPCFGDQLENSLWLQKIGVGVALVSAEAADPNFKREKVTAENVVEAVRVVERTSSIQEAAHSWSPKLKAAVGPGGSSTLDFQKFVTFG